MFRVMEKEMGQQRMESMFSCRYIINSGELNEDELRELYTRIGSVFDSDDGNDEFFLVGIFID